MLTYYSDIAVEDFDSVHEAIRNKDSGCPNLTGDRIIIKWDGDTPSCITDLGCTVRTHEEAINYYNNPVNGWVREKVD